MTRSTRSRRIEPRHDVLSERSAEQIELAMARADMGWLERNLRTNVCIGSPSISHIFGFEPGRRTWHFDEIRARILDEDRARHAREAERAAATLKSDVEAHGFEYRIQRADGEIRHIQLRYCVRVEGEQASSYALVFDVTAGRHIEESLRAGKAWLDLAVDSAKVVLWEYNPDTGYFRATDNCREFFDLPRSHALPDLATLLSRIHPEDRPRIEAAYRSLSAHGALYEPRFRVVTQSGRLRWLSARSRLYRDETLGTRLVGVTWDTTAEQEAAVALAAEQASEQRLARVAEMIPGAIYQARLEPDGTFAMTYCSEGIRALCGLTPEAVQTDPAVFPRRLHRDDLKSLIVSTHHSAANLCLWRLEFRMRRDDDTYCWVLGQAMPVREDDGAVTWHGHLLDITERKQAEEERERLNAQLRQAQKMEAIGLLTGGIAHDFNNILASILGYSGLAQRRFGVELPDKLGEYLHEIHAAGERARDLTAQLLAFSRGQPAAVSAVDVVELLEQSMRMLRPTLPSSIQVDIDLAANLPAVMADPVQLQQVIVNLCINARDAIADSGLIHLRLRRRAYTTATCASCHGDFGGDYLVLNVADDGPGIPAATRERIFEPFFSTKASAGGTGMGLAMVHGIVHNHAGHIVLCDSAYGGACFSILLPVPDQPLPTGTPELDPVPAARAARALRVLVIDDEPAVGAYLAELLELAGYQVQRETDARRALARFMEAPAAYDAILTDQTMPYLTGGQLAQAALAVREDIPIVVMTGYSATIDEKRAHELGVRAFLHKPVSSNALLDTMAAVCTYR